MTFLKSSLYKDERCAYVVFGIFLLGSIIVIYPSCALDPGGGPGRVDMKQVVENKVCDMQQVVENKECCCTCSRELWRVLLGGATTLASLLVSLGGWYHSNFLKDKKLIFGFPVSPFRAFITIVAGSLVPQIFMSFVLSSALAAMVLQLHVAASNAKTEGKGKRKDKGKAGPQQSVDRNGKTEEFEGKREAKGKRLAKRICTMVVWIRIDEDTYDSVFLNRPSLSGLFGTDHKKISGSEKGEKPEPGIEDALFFKGGKSLRALPAHHTSTAEINQPRPAGTQAYYYLCSQGWDTDNLLWKEALLQTEGVLPEVEELQMIQTRTDWECLIVAMQSLGYLVSFLSRFAYGRGARVSAVEVMSAWISVALVVQVLIIPSVATYCKRGICLDLSKQKLTDVVKYYEQKKERKEMLNWRALSVLVLCLMFLFTLFLILIPPLVYYYYRLNSSVLTFVSLLPFTILSGISIMAFVLTLIFPPHDVIFDFVAFPFLKPPRPRARKSSRYMPVISVGILLVGLSCYVLAVIDTILNWHLFRARDCSMSSFIIPHIGS